MANVLIVWRFVDGKPGHENQTLGLLEALRARTPVRWQDVPVGSRFTAVGDLMRGRLPAVVSQGGRPDLLLGAGRNTHLPMLQTKWKLGVPAVVLMSPSAAMIPLFDACIVPEHDGITGRRIVTTHGTLTNVRPGESGDPTRGLFLIGGPSQHHGWDEEDLARTIEVVLEDPPGLTWKLSTSRRTPPSTLERLVTLESERLHVVPFADTGPGWLLREIRRASRTWVTEDSVSMVFDSLTAGNWTGVLPVPRRRAHSRVFRCIDQLVDSGRLHRFGEQVEDFIPAPPLDEADRIASWLLDSLLTPRLRVA